MYPGAACSNNGGNALCNGFVCSNLGLALKKQTWGVKVTLFTVSHLFSAEILQANDNLTQVINLYKQLVRGEEINGETVASPLRGEWGDLKNGAGGSSRGTLLLVS